MKDHKLKLINSTYSINDAREVLFSLISDKIKFLNLQILSANERYGNDSIHLENRVKQLQTDKETLIAALNQLDSETHRIAIDCDVTVKVKHVELA
ncbi:hypothetical protein [Leptobacterium sp. I13]|uniref:hypothetical protein n=1 Tax=Leptobacterium meishanense TaxID=3128904 RepID=UPI0030EC5DDB